MKLQTCACIDTLYRELPFLDRFEAAKRDGFAFVEFWNWTDKDLNAVKAAAERAGIGIAGFNGDAELSLIDPDQRRAYLDYLSRSVKAAKWVGARSVTLHSNGLGEGGAVINAYPEIRDSMKRRVMLNTLEECARLAEGSGVRMNLEPLNTAVDHPGCFLTTTREAVELIDLVGSPMLRVLYDVYHMYYSEGDPCETIRAHAGMFGHVHAADAPGRHEPGTGEIDYHKVFACLEDAGYQGLVGFELFPSRSTAEAVAAIRKY